jgi:hypothetical protein
MSDRYTFLTRPNKKTCLKTAPTDTELSIFNTPRTLKILCPPTPGSHIHSRSVASNPNCLVIVKGTLRRKYSVHYVVRLLITLTLTVSTGAAKSASKGTLTLMGSAHSATPRISSAAVSRRRQACTSLIKAWLFNRMKEDEIQKLLLKT